MSPSPGTESRTNDLCSECGTDAESSTLTFEITRHYAVIRLKLRAGRTPILAIDVWVAALGQQHATPVTSRDGNFDFIRG